MRISRACVWKNRAMSTFYSVRINTAIFVAISRQAGGLLNTGAIRSFLHPKLYSNLPKYIQKSILKAAERAENRTILILAGEVHSGEQQRHHQMRAIRRMKK